MTKVQMSAGAYKQKQVETASPAELVVLVYDVALFGCVRCDVQKALQALSVLRSALDLDSAPEIGNRLYAIYQYCEECIRARDFDTPAKLLRELRGAWVEVGRRTRQEEMAAINRPHATGLGALSIAG